MIDIKLKKQGVYLGRAGETGRKRVWVDITAWEDEYGPGEGLMLYRNPEGKVIPMETVREEGTDTEGQAWVRLYGTVGETETAVAGVGNIEARLLCAGVVAKSDSFGTVVASSMDTGKNEDEKTPKWVRQLMTDLKAARIYVDTVKEIEDVIDGYRDAAEEQMLASEAWAVGTRDGEPVEETDPTYGNSSKKYASDSEAWAVGKRGGVNVDTDDETYEYNAKKFAMDAGGSAAAALILSREAEAWAKGTKAGVPVPATDPAYEQDAKHYADMAGENAEAWANGTRNGQAVPSTDPAYEKNAKYWSDHAFSATPEGYEDLVDGVDDLKSAFTKVDEALITQETVTTVVTADSGVTWENGYFWGSSSGIMTKSAYAGTSCAIYGNVQKGDIFRVTARSAGSAYALYLADANGTRLDYFVSPSGNAYYADAEYIVPSDGVLYLNTVTASYITADKLYKLDSISRDYYPIDDLKNEIDETAETANANTSRLDDLEESLPTKQIFVDVMSDLVFVDGKYVSSGGTVTDYASTKYAVYGSVATGEKFMFSGRKVGSCYCILLVTDAEPVSGKYTVLDVVTEGYNETSYITDAIYTVPQNGYLIYQSLKSATLKLEKNTTFFDITASPLNGINWVTIGDSLNEFNSTAKNNWIKYMIADTGVINTNLASSGTGFYRGIATDDHPTAANYIAKLSRIPADTQLITIAGSFNDLTTSPWPQLPVGTSSDTGTETIAGYMNDFFDALIEAFPLVPIGVYMTAPWSNYHYGVERSDSYVSVLKEICLKKGIPFFDNAYYGNTLKPWNTANRTEYYTHDNGTVDGVHPNDKGHVFIYQMLKPFIESLSPKNPLADINS